MRLTRKNVLLLSSFLVFPIMVLVFNITTNVFSVQTGYLAGLVFYWCYCLVFIFATPKRELFRYLRFRRISKKEYWYLILTFVPILGAMYVNFIPYLSLITLPIFLLVIITSLVNGTIEEVYWRGLYLVEYKENTRIGLWLATFLFGVWHISLYTISEISYGGFAPLVFGAAFMGLLWAFCSRKLQSIVWSILGHIAVNIFAFTGLYIENGF